MDGCSFEADMAIEALQPVRCIPYAPAEPQLAAAITLELMRVWDAPPAITSEPDPEPILPQLSLAL